MGEETLQLAQLAPTLARWPRFMRRLSGAAFWTGISVLFLGASALFWRTVTLGTEYALVHQDVQLLQRGLDNLDKLQKDQNEMKLDLNTVKINSANTMTEVQGMKRWREMIECIAERGKRRDIICRE